MLPLAPTRIEIRTVLDRNHGSKIKLAKRAKVTPPAVTNWLKGGKSSNIAAKAIKLYRELRAKEKELAAAA